MPHRRVLTMTGDYLDVKKPSTLTNVVVHTSGSHWWFFADLGILLFKPTR